MTVYSIESPLGAAIAGARPGERRTYRLPNGALAVTLLKAVPYGLHTADVNPARIALRSQNVKRERPQAVKRKSRVSNFSDLRRTERSTQQGPPPDP
jgi:hypothetical protein